MCYNLLLRICILRTSCTYCGHCCWNSKWTLWNRAWVSILLTTYVATVHTYVIIIATHLGIANFCWSYLAAFVSVSNDVKRMHLNYPHAFKLSSNISFCMVSVAIDFTLLGCLCCPQAVSILCVIVIFVYSCWLSEEDGTIWAFVVPMVLIILVSLINYYTWQYFFTMQFWL